MTQYRLRSRYPFDPSLEQCSWGVKYWETWKSEDGKTYYVEAGANAGIRLLAHYEDGELFTASHFHAFTLVEAGNQRETVERFLRAAFDHSTPNLLMTPEVAGFYRPSFLDVEENAWYHPGGWYTTSVYIIPAPPPAWAPNAQAWRLREGVLVQNPPESDRLVPVREYFQTFELAPVAQLDGRAIWPQSASSCMGTWPLPAVGEEQTHWGEGDHSAPITLYRTEAELILRQGDLAEVRVALETPSGWYCADSLVLGSLPGTDRPFRRGRE